MPTVLIVEDDPVFRRVTSFAVSRCGVQVEAVADGDAAYQRLLRGGVDYLVTDHQMPRCSGIELLEKIDKDPSLECPPTIFCTAKGFEINSEHLQDRCPLIALVHKPFSPRKLTALLTDHIGSRESQRKDLVTRIAGEQPCNHLSPAATSNAEGLSGKPGSVPLFQSRP